MVNYNGHKDTIECVTSLRKINYSNYKIIIVDNSSSDSSGEILKRKLSHCKIIESKKNLGFAGGNNLGIKYALDNKADYVLLLNNDTLVEANFLNNMINSFNVDNRIGLVGCKIMYYPQKNIIWYGGGCIDWFRFIGDHYGMKEIDQGQCDREKEIDFMTGCCMLIKREVFEKAGLLSGDYFMYFEDVDFCVKVKNTGYKIWYNPKAIIYHKVGFSSGGEESPFSIEWGTRNRFIFMNKYKNNVTMFNFILSKIFFYSTRFIRYFQYILSRKKDKANAIIKGLRK
ncbi:glycosyltransferase family 2 protein [Clostridium autoethanogenum]|uniref:Glycosyltransferase family 2 protein n=1 Tax=Clostridium autoethanogenum DSM 10061 TaxID=1341692 RepID=A0ABM5NWF5_9CLOT|nr:glycosyltransferase family 2 protein [Clostridium autoethanogenum]AGY76813.2 glycosyltransferase family 2 protein [Clostridium autoethanogenum DSM 10061]